MPVQKPTVRLVFHFLALILSTSFLEGQPLHPDKELSQYSLDRVSSDKIPSGILKMIQSSDGYLWMATHDNLVSFDGVTVTLYDRFSNPEFKINGFRSVYEDKNKNLWGGSNGGGLFLKKNKSFKKFIVPFGPGSNYIETIFNDSKDNLWLGTMKGLVLFKDSAFVLIPPSFQSPKPYFTIFDFSEDKNGNLWIASSIGVLKYSNGQLLQHTWPGISLDGDIMSIHIDSFQNIWIGSYGKGIFKATENSITKIMELGNFGRSVSIMEDLNHNIWIGSENGVARYSKGGVSKIGVDNGIANVTAICEDHEGSVWLGTYYSGLARLRDGTFTNFSRSNGLPNNTIHSIYQTKDSTIWVGTETNFASYKNGKFTKQSFPQVADSRIRDICADSENNLWIATYNGLFKLRNNVLTKYSTDNGISSERVSVILEDAQKRLWIGTRNGLNLFQNGRWKSFSEKDGLSNTFIMSLIQLRNGTLVVGTNAGLFYLKGELFEPLMTDKGKITETIFRTYEDKDGYLWAGANTGLLVIKDNKVHAYFSEDKLLADVIFQVMEDHLGQMWLTSNIGIIRVSRKELIDRISSGKAPLNTQLFNKSNGLPTNGITGASKGMIAFDKKIWFPTLMGVAVVDPANIVFNKVPPPIVIEKILVDGEEFEPGEVIKVKAFTRNIEIHYTAMSFIAPDKVQFRYLLKGYDKTWHEASDRRAAYFNSLPPGDYTFMLQAKNNDNVWSKNDNAVVLHVQKAFWQTWTFYILTTIGVGLIIYGVVNYRIKSIRELNKRLDERIRERTQEVLAQKEEIEAQRDYIEERNFELERAKNIIDEQYTKLQEVNESLEGKVVERTRELLRALEELDYFVYKSSHDIKGPLARLHGLSNLALMESKEKITRHYLELLQRESILASRVLQKLSYAHQIKNMEIEVQAINLNELLHGVVRQLKIMHTDADHIQFVIDVDKNIVLRSDIKLVKELFASVLENAIVFQSEKDQHVRIHAIANEDEIITSIFDNGVGIHEKAKPSLFKMFYKGSEKSVGLGLGLYIARKVSERLNGRIKLLRSEPGTTEFEIDLPLNLPTNILSHA